MTRTTTCRLCLATDGAMEEIFNSTDPELCKRIYECTNIEIINLSGLPSSICEKCKSQLLVSYKFRQKCFKSNMILKTTFPELFKDTHTDAEDFMKFNEEDELIECSRIENEYEDLEQENYTSIEGETYSSVQVYYNDDEVLKHTRIKKENCHELEISLKQEKCNDEIDECNVVPVNFLTSKRKGTQVIKEEKRTRGSIYVDDHLKPQVKTDNLELEAPLQKPETTKECSKHKVDSETNPGIKENQITKVINENLIRIFDKHKTGSTCSSYRPILRHSGGKSFKCKNCGLEFQQKLLYQHHISTHVVEKKPYKCKLCEESFNNFVSLWRHMYEHKSDLPFQCNFCGISYSYADRLATHKKIHRRKEGSYKRDKTFKCDICSLAFKSSTVLKRHEKIHTRKNVKGTFCENVFIYHGYSKRHMEENH